MYLPVLVILITLLFVILVLWYSKTLYRMLEKEQSLQFQENDKKTLHSEFLISECLSGDAFHSNIHL